jgi:transposase
MQGLSSDVTEEEWSSVAPYLALCNEAAEQRDYPQRAVFSGMCYVVRTGCQLRHVPNDLPP